METVKEVEAIIEERIAELSAKRKSYAGAINLLRPFDGKNIKRLGENTAAEIRAKFAAFAEDVMPQDIFEIDGKTFSLSRLEAEEKNLREEIHFLDALHTRADSWYENYVKFWEAEEKLREIKDTCGKYNIPFRIQCCANIY